MSEIQEWAEGINSGSTFSGRALVVFIFLCNVAAMVSDTQVKIELTSLYDEGCVPGGHGQWAVGGVCLVGGQADHSGGGHRHHITTFQIYLSQIDFALGIIFSLHFLLRLVAAEHFTTFLSSTATIVDLVTLPPLFLSVWLGRTWLGLRCFRFFILINLPNVLVYVRLLENSSSIRFAQVTQFYVRILYHQNIYWYIDY